MWSTSDICLFLLQIVRHKIIALVDVDFNMMHNDIRSFSSEMLDGHVVMELVQYISYMLTLTIFALF